MIQIQMKIKELREDERISLRELARRTGIERHYLSKLEKLDSTNILLADAILIANAMGKRVDDLYNLKIFDII